MSLQVKGDPLYIHFLFLNERFRSNRSNGCETSSQVFHNLLHFSTLLYTSPYLRYFTKDLKLKKILSGVGLIHLWPDPIFGCLHGRFGLKRAVTDGSASSSDHYTKLTDAEIKDNILTMIIAGPIYLF